jgi:anti-sigma-K factor RskA
MPLDTESPDHLELRELAAPYALHALDDLERRRFERHLAECPRCTAEVASFRDTAAALAYADPVAEPPPELRHRVLAAAAAEQGAVSGNVTRFPRVRRPALVAVAAVAAGVALALGVWNVSLARSLDDEREARTALASALALVADSSAERISLEGAEGSLVVAGDGAAALLVCRLPQPPSGMTYEAWVVQDGNPQRAGEFAGDGGCAAHRLTEPVAPGSVVAVTIERRGGVDSPSGEPVFASEPV